MRRTRQYQRIGAMLQPHLPKLYSSTHLSIYAMTRPAMRFTRMRHSRPGPGGPSRSRQDHMTPVMGGLFPWC
jgi:hypothetical protein